MENQTFSIIVPVYDVEQYLENCINSVLNQSFRNFQLILVDDGSKDSSGEICDRFAQKDSRVKVIHKPNAGVSAARNTGIDIATGQFICFIDSDDWIESEYLQKIVDEIYDFDILFFGSVWHYEDGCSRSLSLQNSEYKKDIYTGIFHLLENDIDINYFGFTWNKVFRRDIIEQYRIRFIENLAISEDEVFTLNYCNHIKSLKIIDVPLYHYLWKSQGLTHKKRQNEEWILLAYHFLKLAKEIQNNELSLYYKNRVAGIFNNAAWSCTNPLGLMKGELRMTKYCIKNHVPLPVKSIGREFLNKII